MATSRLIAQRPGPAVLQARRAAVARPRHASLRPLVRVEATVGAAVSVKTSGTATLQGTSR
jgi:hypothetical protein